ncbi:Guanyl-specific ribonuclease Sa [Corynebacterium glaucum]|uniref:Guanyl-specific ribonuclease Sa n=1 Tax=Corynebacterium glaucum TaxID=187491 RepID=A0A1Q2HY87_9CORY|nr:Guanyl-specific ribonuclease Sa [Corynebacterium glaucum]WJZ08296.1 Guanyl-specific ribonuclease Sa [Corynebacterium glaucum]
MLDVKLRLRGFALCLPIGGLVCGLLSGCAAAPEAGPGPKSEPETTSVTSVSSETSASTAKAPATQASGTGPSGLELCEELPDEVWDTVALVDQGGPFPYPDNDDSRFGNYERVLPDEKLGYYREYTVETPGVRHRGARRVVTGGGADGDVDSWFYTADHYDSFCEISESQLDEKLDEAKEAAGV